MTSEHELKLARSEESRKHLDELCLQELGVNASEAGASLEELPTEVDLDALEEEIAQVKIKIERLGGVNLESIEEFSELEERHTFLTKCLFWSEMDNSYWYQELFPYVYSW